MNADLIPASRLRGSTQCCRDHPDATLTPQPTDPRFALSRDRASSGQCRLHCTSQATSRPRRNPRPFRKVTRHLSLAEFWCLAEHVTGLTQQHSSRPVESIWPTPHFTLPRLASTTPISPRTYLDEMASRSSLVRLRNEHILRARNARNRRLHDVQRWWIGFVIGGIDRQQLGLDLFQIL